MKLQLCIPTVDPELMYRAADLAARSRSDVSVELVTFCNGGEIDEARLPYGFPKFITDSVPDLVGIPAALHRLYELARGLPDPSPDDVLCFVQDDMWLLEYAWDRRVLAAFERDEKLGLAGCGGARGVGADTLYKEPYDPGQLGRTEFLSNYSDANLHGTRWLDDTPAVFFDGNSLFVRRAFLDQIDGWSRLPARFVMYGFDCFIACMARRHGWRGMLIPLAAHHYGSVFGGTRGSKRYLEWAERFGGDRKVHDDVHEWLYNEFRDVLPIRV